jgi:hypothetical protein
VTLQLSGVTGALTASDDAGHALARAALTRAGTARLAWQMEWLRSAVVRKG